MSKKYLKYPVFLYLFTGILSTADSSSEQIYFQNKQSVEYTVMGNYSEDDIKRIFNEVRKSSFTDISDKTELVFKDFKYFGFASPFSMNVLINLKKINACALPEEAVRGLIAHELSHQVSFIRRSNMGKILYIWSYPFSSSRKKMVEKEADEITIERGYSNEILLMRKYKFSCDKDKYLEKSKQVYLSVEELEKLIDAKNSK